MLKSIIVLDKLKPLSYLENNEDFRRYLKLLTPFFQYDYATASQADHEMWFYNLLYIAERDLSLAHCVQHNQTARLSIELNKFEPAKKILNSYVYSDLICSYSDSRAMDTILYDKENSCLTPGVKGWLSNLKSADICVIRVLDTAKENHYDVFLDLRNIDHTRSFNAPASLGMSGASPGVLGLDTSLSVGTDVCFVLVENPVKDDNYLLRSYVKQCWATVHLGATLGLYNELLKYPELQDPGLKHTLKNIEIELSSLKIMWEHGLETILPCSKHSINDNSILAQTLYYPARATQYAASKKALLTVINLILEMGLHYFIDEGTPTCTRFKDALTYVTHMHSLYRCNNRYQSYNNLI